MSAHSLTRGLMMSLPVNDVTYGSVHYFYGGRMICVTGLRGYRGTELNNIILLNNHEFT